MVPSNVYSKALYDLAEEIDKNEGRVTCSSVLVEGAAERIDMQTMTIRGLEIQRDELMAALEKCRKELSAWMRDHGDDIATQETVADARAAIASVKGAAINPASLLPDERECCGTFPRTPHRSTCKNYRGKKGGAA